MSINRMNNFNILRYLSVLMVMYGHMFPLLGITAIWYLNESISTLGVYVLFTISGFLVKESLNREIHFSNYFLKRVFRIFPGLILVVFLSAFVIGPVLTSLPLKDYFASPILLNYLKNIFLYINYHLPGVFELNTYKYAVNGSLWSLPAEFILYMILALIYFSFKKTDIQMYIYILLYIASFTINVYLRYFNQDFEIIFYGFSFRQIFTVIPFFFYGVLFTYACFRSLLNIQLSIILLLISSFLSLSGFYSLLIHSIILPYFILSFALVEKPFFSFNGDKLDLSYGLYLYGFLSQQIIVSIFGASEQPFYTLLLLSILLTIVFSVISWYVVERPSKSVLMKILNRN